MRLAVVLPSSAAEWLEQRRADYARHARPGTLIVVQALHERVPRDADPSDDFLVPEILEQVVLAERSGADAVVVDCMEDPGVEEARRLVRIPVVGPGSAALRLAALLSYRFSILYPLPQTRLMERLVLRHGLTAKVASIRYLSSGLDDIRRDPQSALECMLQAAVCAVREDGAHAIVPACTLTSALSPTLVRRLRDAGCPVPVVDGPGAAVKVAEGLVETGLVHSRLTYPPPLGISRRVT